MDPAFGDFPHFYGVDGVGEQMHEGAEGGRGCQLVQNCGLLGGLGNGLLGVHSVMPAHYV